MGTDLLSHTVSGELHKNTFLQKGEIIYPYKM